MKRMCTGTVVSLGLLIFAARASGFCGFYVSQAGSKLFNKASQVVLVRSEDKTVMTMSSDYRGEPGKFAIVIPVPTVLEKEQVHVGSSDLVERLDKFSAPRLTEYFDPDPCPGSNSLVIRRSDSGTQISVLSSGATRYSVDGVRVERSFKVDEYEIMILSADDSEGLLGWLHQHDYRVPDAAEPVVRAYLKQGMHFFVARVNLVEQRQRGFKSLRPIQIAYESPRLMLPIRLGMVNSDGPQDLFIYAITPRGRVECTNYRTVRLPTGIEVPLFVKEKFPDFYRDLFTRQVQKESDGVVFTEYAWDTGTCDPCATQPLYPSQLRALGAFWLDEDKYPSRQPGSQAFVTRLHVRYDAARFPEDLAFQVTADDQPFQGLYVMRHPWNGQGDCPEVKAYVEKLKQRRQDQARNVAELTGWAWMDILKSMSVGDDAVLPSGEPLKWYQKLWPK